MSTRTPIYASIPFSSLAGCLSSPEPTAAASPVATKTRDELFGELDDEASDSGYDEEEANTDGSSASKLDVDTEEHSPAPPHHGLHVPTSRALADAPPLFSSIKRHNPGFTGTGAPPPWTKWTDSTVTCLSTAYGTNEDRVDCIWLVAGCQDGSVWIFCSILLTSAMKKSQPQGRSSTNHSSPDPDAGHGSDTRQRIGSMPNLFAGTGHHRPGMPRKISDSPGRRYHDTHTPPALALGSGSPKSSSKAGSVMSTRSLSNSQHQRKGRGHSHSMSLARSGIATPTSGHHHGRKASATVSVSDADALRGMSTGSEIPGTAFGDTRFNKELPSPPVPPVLQLKQSTPSPQPSNDGRPSFSFEELPKLPDFEYDKVAFQPIAQVHLDDAAHSPLASVHILPQQGCTTPFVALTRSGKAYRLSCQDGTLLGAADLGSNNHSTECCPIFDKAALHERREGPLLLAFSQSTGLLVPCELNNMTVLTSASCAPDSKFSVLGSGDAIFLVELRQNGHIYTSELTLDAGQQPSKRDWHDAGSIALGSTSDPEGEAPLLGIKVDGEDVIVWSTRKAGVLRFVNQKVQLEHVISSNSVLLDVHCVAARKLALVSENMVRFDSMTPSEDHCLLLDFSLNETIECSALLVPPTSTDDCIVLVSRDTDGSRSIAIAPAEAREHSLDSELHIAYEGEARELPVKGQRIEELSCVTSATRIADNVLVLGMRAGTLAFSDLASSLCKADIQECSQSSGAVVLLEVIVTESTTDQFIVAATVGGCLQIWHGASRYLLAHFDVFSSPPLSLQKVGFGLIAVAADGTIALVRGDALTNQPAILPGAQGGVGRLYLRHNRILIVYETGRARLWDIETLKVQKTLSRLEINDILQHMEDWKEVILSTPSSNAYSVDLRPVLERTSRLGPGSRTDESLDPFAKWLLGRYLLPHHEDYVDRAVKEHLCIPSIEAGAVTSNSVNTTASYSVPDAEASLKISQKISARRTLIAVALCRLFLNFAETERYANEVIAYYATVGDRIGEEFKDFSLDYLTEFWLDESNDLRQAARLLFSARVARLSDVEVLEEVQERQARIVSGATPAQPKELLILGEIAIAKQDLLVTGTLRNIADQISRSLDMASDAEHQTVSLELLVRAFSIFQAYFVDAVRVLRSIFRLSTTTSSSVPIPVRNLARQAILTVASVNAPLFMTVLSFAAMQAGADPEERAATLKLIAFMVRKKPVVLFATLPKLIEAVVASLDPRTGLRGALQQTATVILSELVNTYPSIAFHGKTQRLAIGTHEGACIVYDLKTATRLYVLESHKKRASAVSYSPDGRRLVTLSLEELNVKVWKVGVSLLGLLTPAGPPPQRHGAGSHDPYKTIDFVLASPEEAMMTAAAQLEWLKVEWQDDRRVRISIRETALTFSVV